MLSALFWAFEIIPLYAISMMAVLLLIFLLGRPDGVPDMDKSGYVVFLFPISSPVIMLFFGGFMLSSALTKHRVDNLLAGRLMGMFGNKPKSAIMGFMLTSAFLSMWVSNTATAAIMLVAMVGPLLSRLESGDPLRTSLVLAIAFGANIGGIGTPIGTPPNAIALGILSDNGIYIDFLTWMLISIPLVVIILFVTRLILLRMFPSKQKEVSFSVPNKGSIGGQGSLVILISLVTIILWLTSSVHKIPEAIIALLAAGSLVITGMLNKDDLKRTDWDILVLMWGGLALGTGMEISGLSKLLVDIPIFKHHGLLLILIFCVLAVSLSNFISNTAAANLLIPIVMSLPGEDNTLLAVSVALSCSFAMAFPISTPPNAMAYSTNIISGKDMFKSGMLISLISMIPVLFCLKLVITVAFKIANL